MDVTVLCDAVAVFPEAVEEALPGWGESHAAWTAEVMPGNVAGDGWFLHFHSYLVTSDAGVVLVDAGVGPADGEAAEWLGVAGRLPALLTAAGVGPTDVDAVVLTHIHLDHVGWAADGVQPLFPNAEYVVQRAELAPGSRTYEHRIRPIVEAGQLRAIEGTALVRGTRLVPAPGHTPGHQVVVTDRAVLGGDVLVHPAQARWPELTYVYERDPPVAVTSRREVLALAAELGVPIAAAHTQAPLTADAQAVQVGDCPVHKLQR